MKMSVLFVMLVPLLWSCATAETRPAVNASAYLFDLDVSVDPQLAEFDPNVSRGGGSGMLRGAGMGAGGCLYAGASLDGASNGGAFPLGTAMGIFISPACALVGSVVGGSLAETKEDVAQRTEALNDMARELGYPDELARVLADDVKSGPIYHIAGTPDGEAWSKDVSGASSWQSEAGYFEPEAEFEAAVAFARVVTSTDEAIVLTNTAKQEGVADVVAASPLIEDAELAPILRPTEPNASIRFRITYFGFTGRGVDPKLPLQVAAKLCVTRYDTGESMVFQNLTASSKAMKLEDWAQLKPGELEAETQTLLQRISKQAQAVMGRQVKLNYKTSCGAKNRFGRLSQPLSQPMS